MGQDPTRTQAQEPGKPHKRWRAGVAQVALAVALFVGIGAYQSRDLLSAQPAPMWSATDLQGAPHQSTSYHGKKTLMYMWAPWCGVCSMVSDNIVRVADWMPDVHVISMALAYKDEARVRAYAKEHSLPGDVILGSVSIQRAFRVSAFPTVYVLDEQGRVEDAVVGYTSTFGLLWRLWI